MKTWKNLKLDDPIYILTIYPDKRIKFVETKFMGSQDCGDFVDIRYFDDNPENHHWSWNSKVDEPTLGFAVYVDDLNKSWVGCKLDGNPDVCFYADYPVLVDDLIHLKNKCTAKIIHINTILDMFVNNDGSPKIIWNERTKI